MTPEAQRIAIAQACGWEQDDSVLEEYPWFDPTGEAWKQPPDYLDDLNAMHEAEKVLTDELFVKYANKIPPCATASQRAEAFLRTLNLWRDDA